MARGNQREKSREANLKKQQQQKKANNLSGSQMRQSRESNAKIMQEKQNASDKKKAEAAAGGN